MFTELASQLIYSYTCCVTCSSLLLKPYVMQVKLFHLEQKSWISSHGSAHYSQLRYDSQHLWRGTIQWYHQPINRTKILHNSCFSGSIKPTIKWKKRAMNFLNGARISITKFNDLQALFVYKTIHGWIIDETEDAREWNKTRNVRELFKIMLPKR